MTDADQPDRPNPRPNPRPGAEGAVPNGAVPNGSAPDGAAANGAPPRPPRRRVRGAAPSSPTTAPTQAVEAVVPERVLVGAAGLSETESSSVFALESGPPVEPFDLDRPGDWVRIPRRSGWLRRALIVVIVLGAIAGVAGVSLGRWLHVQVHPAGDHGAPVEFTIEQGAATNTVANNLAAKHVIANATVFRYWLRRQGGEQTFQAGDYDLFERMDYPELLTVLRAGPKPPVQIKVTIPPGLTLGQTKALLLEKLPGFDATEFDQALARAQLSPSFYPLAASREGLLFPDTYNVDEDASTNEYALLKRMRDQMDKVLKDLDVERRANSFGLGTYDILKVASLIEEEAKIDADRPKIARVIYNRIERGMSLGIDASTRFAVGKTNGEPLTLSDLASDSPFNTRKAVGLPPSPIALPSKKSIEAALSPTANERWLYYVLTDEGGVKGAHTFANTNAEFNAAVRVCRDLGYCD